MQGTKFEKNYMTAAGSAALTVVKFKTAFQGSLEFPSIENDEGSSCASCPCLVRRADVTSTAATIAAIEVVEPLRNLTIRGISQFHPHRL
jgi:hypothetical protein